MENTQTIEENTSSTEENTTRSNTHNLLLIALITLPLWIIAICTLINTIAVWQTVNDFVEYTGPLLEPLHRQRELLG